MAQGETTEERGAMNELALFIWTIEDAIGVLIVLLVGLMLLWCKLSDWWNNRP